MTTKKKGKVLASAPKPEMSRARIEAQVRAFYMQMMDSKGSAASRIAAAKALMERMDKIEGARAASLRAKRAEGEPSGFDRAAAIEKARELLTVLEAGKMGSKGKEIASCQS